MALGALVCFLVGRLVPPSSPFAALYYPGSYLFTAGDLFFLAAPVIAWMAGRGHDRRRQLEMAVLLLAPVAAVAVLGELAGWHYRLWLVTAMYPLMSLAMVVFLLRHRV
jgi:hypothetical protein